MEKEILIEGIDFKSSQVASMELDSKNLHLKITYKFGKSVPYEFCLKELVIWKELKKAESKGNYISKKLKNRAEFNLYKNGCTHSE